MEPEPKSPKVATIVDVGQNFEETVKKNAKLFIFLNFPTTKGALTLLRHFSHFGPRFSQILGRSTFWTLPLLSDSACPKAARLLYTARL